MKKLAIKLLVIAGLLAGTTGASIVALPAAPADAGCYYASYGVTCTESTVVKNPNCSSPAYEPATRFGASAAWAKASWMPKGAHYAYAAYNSVVRAFGTAAVAVAGASKWQACNALVTKTCTNYTTRTPCKPR